MIYHRIYFTCISQLCDSAKMYHAGGAHDFTGFGYVASFSVRLSKPILCLMTEFLYKA